MCHSSYISGQASFITIIFEKVLSNRLINRSRNFNSSMATPALVFNIFKAFGRARHAGFFDKLKSYEITGLVFGLILSFLGNIHHLVVLGEKEVFARVLQ